MSMTRRQAATIIGLLFSIFLIISIVSIRALMQAQDGAPTPGPYQQLLPVVAGEDGIVSSEANEESPLAHEHPVGELDEPTEGKPAGEVLAPEVLAKMREDAVQIAAEMKIIPASGPETMGSTITVAGKEIKLPDNVYIVAEVVAVTCGEKCPEVPYLYLKYKDSDIGITVGERTGAISNYAPTAEAMERNRIAFQWLIDALESK